MSKISDALKKAEETRLMQANGIRCSVTTAGILELVEERLESGTAQHPVRNRLDEHGNGHATTLATPGARVGATHESWQQALGLVQQQLAHVEQEEARHIAEQARLNAQLAVSEQLAADAQQQQAAVRQRLAHVAQAIVGAEKTKAPWLRQLEALRACQELSQACRMAQRELEANAALVIRASEEWARHRQQGEQLRRRVDELRFQLGNALAATGTTDESFQHTMRHE